MKKYEIIEHTADIGIKAYGRTLAESFENISKAMFDIITDNSNIDKIGQYHIKLKSTDLDQLLVDWLSELLFLNSAKNLVFGQFNIKIDEKNIFIDADIYGEEYNKLKHKIGVEIKAVTYHMLQVNNNYPYSTQILFDI